MNGICLQFTEGVTSAEAKVGPNYATTDQHCSHCENYVAILTRACI